MSRLRDQKGNAIPLSAVGNAAVALVGALLRSTLGFRPARPSISQTAARRLLYLLPKSARVAEFGSGMSTVWFARHFAGVVSIEHEPGWSARVQARLRHDGLTNVEYLIRTPADYAAALDSHADGSFDLLLVDGLARDLCLTRALPKVKPGGYVYLDNTDTDLDIVDGEMRRAEGILHAAVRESGGTLETFTDFAPINFFAEQGTLVRLGPTRR